MNRLAIQSHLLGAQMLGLENLMVLQGDRFTEKDLARVKDVSDFKPTELIQAVAAMNQGIDFKGLKLTRPTNFCIGASVDLGRGVQREARLAHRKETAGAHFFLTQPVFSTGEMEAFLDAYQEISGEVLSQPVFFGLQVLVSGGVIFSNVPEAIRQDLEKGRAGTDIALELLHKFQDAGFRRIYLIPPILKGGSRDYQAAQKVLKKARMN
jgi:homocysteine S-methyltransferase